MGGFTGFARDIIEATGKTVASTFNRPSAVTTATHLADSVESGIYHAVLKPEKAFQQHPAAQKLWQAYSGPFHELSNKYSSEIGEQAKRAGSIKPFEEILSEGRKKASDQVFGPNREVIQGVLKHVENTSGKNKADILADHLNILLKEAPYKTGKNAGLSSFDVDMRKGGLSNKGFETNPSKYTDAGVGERIARAHQKLIAYKSAIPHLASNLNILMADGFSTYAKTLATVFGPNRAGAEAQVLASNSISELNLQGYIEKQKFDRGIIKQFIPGSAGEFIHRNMYIPGMPAVRYNTLLASAIASKYAAEEAAQHLVQGNTKRALPLLRELGLDASKISAQRGQLLPEDISKAYYHGTNFRGFLQQGDKRTVLGQQSGLYRVTGAFHTYVANQASFFRQVFKRQYQQGDFLGISRNIALMTLGFPIVGATIAEAESLLIGKDWDDPSRHFKDKLHNTYDGYIYDKATGQQNAVSGAQATLGTIEMLAHIASFGVATSYTRAATRAHLANQILGPEGNMVVQGAEDALKARKTDINHPDAWKPLARDVMSDIPTYGAGSIASHKLLPTKAEESKKKFHKFRRTRPKPESWNPLNSDDFKY